MEGLGHVFVSYQRLISAKTELGFRHKQWMTSIVLKLNDLPDNPNNLIQVQWERVPGIGERITLPSGWSYRISDIETTLADTTSGLGYEPTVTTLYCTKLTRCL